MKKILCIALVIVMVFALAATAFADAKPSTAPVAADSASGGGEDGQGGQGQDGQGEGQQGGATKDGTKDAGTKAAAAGKSPQTGYNVAIWTIAGVAMLIGAGYCFSATRKVTAE